MPTEKTNDKNYQLKPELLEENPEEFQKKINDERIETDELTKILEESQRKPSFLEKLLYGLSTLIELIKIPFIRSSHKDKTIMTLIRESSMRASEKLFPKPNSVYADARLIAMAQDLVESRYLNDLNGTINYRSPNSNNKTVTSNSSIGSPDHRSRLMGPSNSTPINLRRNSCHF